jgi:hypothetical protein
MHRPWLATSHQLMEVWPATWRCGGWENPCHTSTCLQTSAAKGNLNISEDPFPVDHDKMHKEVWCGHPLFARLLVVRIRVQAKSLHLFSASAFPIKLLRNCSKDPTNCIWYANFAVYFSFGVHFQLTESSTFGCMCTHLGAESRGRWIPRAEHLIHALLCCSWAIDFFLHLTKKKLDPRGQGSPGYYA